nr:hypothetical protein [Tanacetum cinerariifolium]
GVYLVKKPLISSRLATLDQPEVTMDLITLPERELGQAQRPKTSASWEAPHAYPFCMSKYSRKCEDSYQRILSSKSSFPQLPLGIMELGQAQRPKTSASWEAPHAYP